MFRPQSVRQAAAFEVRDPGETDAVMPLRETAIVAYPVGVPIVALSPSEEIRGCKLMWGVRPGVHPSPGGCPRG